MRFVFLSVFIFLVVLQSGKCGGATQNAETKISPTPKTATKFERLPENITLDTKVVKTVRDIKGNVVLERTTVEERLIELKARYKKDKLIDEKGKEIRFFEPLCRGVSAGEEQDEADRKAKEKELTELEKKYTVIVLVCDPRKAM